MKLCVRGSLRKVQKQPSVREQPVQRSWGGNDLVCSGKRRHLRVGLEGMGIWGKIKGGLGHAGDLGFPMSGMRVLVALADIFRGSSGFSWATE